MSFFEANFFHELKILFRKNQKSRFLEQISIFFGGHQVVAKYLVAHIEFSQALVWNFFRRNFSI